MWSKYTYLISFISSTSERESYRIQTKFRSNIMPVDFLPSPPNYHQWDSLPETLLPSVPRESLQFAYQRRKKVRISIHTRMCDGLPPSCCVEKLLLIKWLCLFMHCLFKVIQFYLPQQDLIKMQLAEKTRLIATNKIDQLIHYYILYTARGRQTITHACMARTFSIYSSLSCNL
jgi:hypothetical protein